MAKFSLKNDYSEGCHPRILETLGKTNLKQEIGYGEDEYSKKAIQLIRRKLNNPKASIHFASGGTQVNLIVISSILKPYESVVSATIGHIATHEAGAIEATGHKINTIETKDGKLTPQLIKPVLDFHSDEHMVKPRLVFISNSTEVGSVYTKSELKRLSDFCKKNNLLLYLDGARLGSALTSKQNDLTLADISKLVDIFYIGGTKNGALLGEAIIISNDKLKDLKEEFRFHLKQRGALLAKGRILGIQFLELFKDDLFFKLGKHANLMALKLAKGIKDAGYDFLTKPVSNQIFPIFPKKVFAKMSRKYDFYAWQETKGKKIVSRLVTSWATKESDINKFISELKKR